MWLTFTCLHLTQVALSKSEPNNNFVDALNIGEEKDIRGELTEADMDLFKLNIVGEAQHWRIQVLGRQEGISKVTIYDENQNSQGSLEIPTGEKRARLDDVLLGPGTYFVAVEGENAEYIIRFLPLESSLQEESESTTQQESVEETTLEEVQGSEETPEHIADEEESEVDQVLEKDESETESEQVSSEEEPQSQQTAEEIMEEQPLQNNDSIIIINPNEQTEVSGTLVGVDTDVLKLNIVGKPQLWLIRAISHNGKLSKITLYDKNLSPKVSLSMPVGEQRASVGDLSLEPSTYFLGVEGEDAEYSIHFLSLGEEPKVEQPSAEGVASEEQETQQATQENSEPTILEKIPEEVLYESRQDSLEEKEPEPELVEQEPSSEATSKSASQEASEGIAEEEIAETETELERNSKESTESDIEPQPRQVFPRELAEPPKLELQRSVLKTEFESVNLPELNTELPAILDIDKLIDQLLEIRTGFPAHNYDLVTLANNLGNDHSAAFEYVRDQIEFEPYKGTLRGAQGTLGARAGNHLDRALLLKALLDLQGIEARLVVGKLAEQNVLELEQRLFQTPLYNGKDTQTLAIAGLRNRALERLRVRANRDYTLLSNVLDDQIHQANPSDASEIEQQAHVWVQALIDGEWLDMDPTLKTAQVGQALGDFEKIIDKPSQADQHAVLIELVAESIGTDSTLEKSTILKHQLTASEAASAQIFLTFSPDTASQGLGGALVGAAGQEKHYSPLLMVDGKIKIGETLPSFGTTKSNAQNFFFGGSDTQMVLVALYLEVTIVSPAKRTKQSRTLLDRVSIADRQSGAFSEDQLLPLELLNEIPAIYGSVHQIVISNGSSNPWEVASGIAFGINFSSQEIMNLEKFKKASLDELLWPIGAINLAIALAAENLSVAALNDLLGLRFFVGAPRVYLVSIVPRVKFGESGLDIEIDLMHDNVSWIAQDNIQSAQIVKRRIRYGVLQQALETTFMEQRAHVADSTPHVVVTSASSDLFGELRLVTSISDLPDEQFPTELIADLHKGHIILLSPGITETWWRFDPQSGEFISKLSPSLGGGRLGRTLPRGTVAGGGMGDRAVQTVWERGRTYTIEEGVRRPPANNCKGGMTEYTIVLCNVSFPISMTTGTAYKIIVGEIVGFVTIYIIEFLVMT